jgi:hypothetical protein
VRGRVNYFTYTETLKYWPKLLTIWVRIAVIIVAVDKSIQIIIDTVIAYLNGTACVRIAGKVVAIGKSIQVIVYPVIADFDCTNLFLIAIIVITIGKPIAVIIYSVIANFNARLRIVIILTRIGGNRYRERY